MSDKGSASSPHMEELHDQLVDGWHGARDELIAEGVTEEAVGHDEFRQRLRDKFRPRGEALKRLYSKGQAGSLKNE